MAFTLLLDIGNSASSKINLLENMDSCIIAIIDIMELC